MFYIAGSGSHSALLSLTYHLTPLHFVTLFLRRVHCLKDAQSGRLAEEGGITQCGTETETVDRKDAA